MATRREVWARLAGDLKPAKLAATAHRIGLGDLPDACATLLKGGARGRFVVDLN
jgi:acrylyl-CoA reductase (NADPH)